MKIDSTITLAFLVSLIAFISPIATTILNNRHQAKMKKEEMFIKRKLEVIENYLSNVGKTLGDSRHNLVDLGTYAGEIFLYTPTEFWEDIEELNRLIFAHENQLAFPKFQELSKRLSSYTSRFIKEQKNGK
ncbi:hypothetical protein [Massiliimalia timonensis]|uniref:hypothetical protein n=1 Tax=Massiliimalia timonensis TaxID=1987501 RepID=UPI000B8B113A|nr:hypothetical protein [Massiliimalia timonensis]MBS7175892.1 hypothetical protein [Clostridiales bacterium]